MLIKIFAYYLITVYTYKFHIVTTTRGVGRDPGTQRNSLGIKKLHIYLADFVRLVFKKSARCFQRILPICQSVPFRCVADGVAGHLAPVLLISLDHLAGFLITLSPNGPNRLVFKKSARYRNK